MSRLSLTLATSECHSSGKRTKAQQMVMTRRRLISQLCSVWGFLVKLSVFLELFLLYEVAGLTRSLAAF